MRNPDLDKKLDIDAKIEEMSNDGEGNYRVINGSKIYQLEEKTQRDIDMNLIINRYRAYKTY